MRLRGLVRKEILQIVRDPSAILIAFLLPVVLLLVNGFGISLDADHMRVAVVIEAPDEATRGMMQALAASPYLDRWRRRQRRRRRERRWPTGEVRGMLVVREDFAQRLRRPARWPATGALVVNATDPNTARILEGYVQGALPTWLPARRSERRLLPAGGIVAGAPLLVQPGTALGRFHRARRDRAW